MKALPLDRKVALGKLRALTSRLAPELTEGMKYGRPSFGDICGLASQKNCMPFCICEGDIVDAYLTQFGQLNRGEGCIRFKRYEAASGHDREHPEMCPEVARAGRTGGLPIA